VQPENYHSEKVTALSIHPVLITHNERSQIIPDQSISHLNSLFNIRRSHS
jgi:hypothetical protein